MNRYCVYYRTHTPDNRPSTAEFWVYADTKGEASAIVKHEARMGNLDYPFDGIEDVIERD